MMSGFLSTGDMRCSPGRWHSRSSWRPEGDSFVKRGNSLLDAEEKRPAQRREACESTPHRMSLRERFFVTRGCLRMSYLAICASLNTGSYSLVRRFSL